MVGSTFRLLSCGKFQVPDSRKLVFFSLLKNKGHLRCQTIFCARSRYILPGKDLGKRLYSGERQCFVNTQELLRRLFIQMAFWLLLKVPI
jgi:hypothetical protein